MKMRKFIIEIHPDGTLTCCEYEDPKDAAKVCSHMRIFYQKLYNKYMQ